MAVDLIQNSFSGGEISPLLEGRTDIPKYSISVRKLRNMFAHITGPASNRPGTYFVGEVKDSTKKTRIIPFKFGTSQMYQLEFGDKYVRFYKDGGMITVTADNVSDWDPTASYAADWNLKLGNYVILTYATTKKLSINAPYGLTNSNTIKIATQANSGDTLAVTQSGDTITIKFANTTASKNSASAIGTQIRALGTVNGVDVSNFKATANAAYSATPPLAGTVTATLLANGNKIYKALQTSANSTGSSNFFPGLETAYWVELTSNSAEEVTSVYAEADLKYIKFVQSADTMFMVCPGYPPQQLTRYTHYNWTMAAFAYHDGPYMSPNITSITVSASATTGSVTLTASSAIFDSKQVGAWWRQGAAVGGVYGDAIITAVTDSTHATASVQNTLAGTGATTNWAEGSWSNYRGWPETICFYQDRLGFGCTLAEPQTTWWSTQSDYTNFAKPGTLTDASPISLVLPSREVHKIQNLINLGDAMAITDEGVWWIGPNSAQAAFTPNTAKQELQFEGGGNYVSPVIAGTTAIYISESGGEILYADFNKGQAGNNSYVGGSLSVFYDHLLSLNGYSVEELAFQKKPVPLILARRDDGQIIAITFNKEQQTNGAAPWDFEYGDAICESMSVIPATGYSETWMIVKHGSDRYIERFLNRSTSKDPADQYFVDCGLSMDNPIAITGVTLSDTITVTAPGHGLNNGDLIDISDITWEWNVDKFMNRKQPIDQINGFQWQVADATTDTFTIQDPEDSSYLSGTGLNGYLSGGYVRKAVSTVSGLDHLEGKTVAILANGNVLQNQTVASGTVSLEIAASRIHIGLPYISDIETLNLEVQTQQGTSQPKNMAVPDLVWRFYNSGGGWTGDASNNMVELNQRTDEVLGETTALVTGDQALNVGIPLKKNQRVYFRQIDPLPITIVALMPRVNIGG